MHELLTFPKGKHDDQVDSVSQFLTWVKNRLDEQPDLVPYFHISEATRELMEKRD